MRFSKVILAVIAVALGTVPLFAQNTELEALAGIQIDFRNPGARSMGMGGAFLGLADDASAAEANPAGLTILRKTEVSLELRHAELVQDLPVTGVYPNLQTMEFNNWTRAAEVQFGSVVIPRGNWAFAVYYHHPVNYQNSGAVLPQFNSAGQRSQEVPQFFFNRDPFGENPPVSEDQCLQDPNNPCLTGTVFPFITAVQVDLKTLGGAFAWKMGRLSLGVAGRYQRFSESAFTYRVASDTLQPASILAQATLDDQGNTKWETDFTVSGGFKYEFSPSFSIGGVYKQGPEFPAPVYLQNVLAGDTDLNKVEDVSFHAPDTAGLGISYRPVPVLTINADAVKVTYSNLTDKMTTNTYGVNPGDLVTNDITEYHVGAEYFLTTRIPIAIRAGWWREPGHAMHFVGPLTCDHIAGIEGEPRIQCEANRITEAIFFPKQKDQNHYSVGVGLAWPSFQIDAAYDTSDLFKVGSLSAVYRF